MWRKVQIGEFLTARKDRFKPNAANAMGLKRVSKIDFSGKYHLVDKVTNTDMILVKSGDLLISGINAEKGAVAVYRETEDALATIHYSSYEFDKDQIDVEYFKWFLKSAAFRKLLLEASGNGIKTELKPKHILPLVINLPDLETQKKIVIEIVSRYTKVSALNEEINLQRGYLQLLRQTILNEAIQGKLVPQDPNDEPASELLNRIKAEKEQLIKEGNLKKEKPLPPITEDEIPFELPEGWVWCRLGEIALCSEAGKSFLCNPRTIENDEWGILKMSAISSGIFLENENKFYKAHLDSAPVDKIQTGDLLFTRASGSKELTGKSALVKCIAKNLLLNDKTIRFRFPECVSVDFINYWNNSLFARDYYNRIMGAKTTTMNNITRHQFNALPIPLPPSQSQIKIIAKVEELFKKTDDLRLQIVSNMGYVGQLLQAILKGAFDGKNEYAVNEVLSMAAEP